MAENPTARLAVLALAALLAGCTAPVEPLAAVGRIDGAVLGPFLNPFGNVTVVLEDLGWTTTTTPLGGFSFVDVPEGTHVLTVTIDGASDREVVHVAAGNVTRIILQVHPPAETAPYVASLRSHAQENLALPGRACDDCAWETLLPSHPERAVLEAAWEGTPLDGRLIVALWHDGRLLAELEVPGDGATHAIEVSGDDLPGPGGHLQVTARYSDDFLPRLDFHADTFLHLHYGLSSGSS